MPSTEEEDRNAKRKAREERNNHSSGSSSSNRRESSDRREKDRARSGRDSSKSAAPGAFAATEASPRSRKGSVKSSGRSDRSQGHSSSRSEGKSRASSSGKSRTSKPATVPGAVTSSDRHRSSGKSRTSKPASVPGAATSTPMSPEAQRQSRKAARGEGSGRSSNRTTAPPGNNDAVQRKLAAAGLANEEAGTKEKQSKSVELNTNEDGEVLLEAMAVEAMEEKPPDQREVDSGGATDAPSPQEPLPEQKKRPVGMIILVVLLLGACGGAGAYFGTRGTSEAAAVATDSTTPIPTSSINVTSSPSTIAPTAPPTKALKYPPPNEADCQRIASATDRSNQIQTLTRNHELEMDVELSNEDIELDLEEIQTAMQQRFMPALAGCSDAVVRQTEIQYLVFNGIVRLTLLEGASCALEHSGPCFVVVVDLTLQLQGQEIPRTINNIIEDTLGTEDLVASWGLNSPFFSPYASASVTEIRLADETPAPSDNPTDALSAQPSLAPSLIALEKPTSAPVIEDIVTITKEPTTLPSVTPTLTTSENPTVAPAIGPTTEEPTRLPSIMPSKAPSVAPTPLPTESPTTKAPTPEPSTMPSSRPTFELMEGDHLQNEHYVHYMPDDGSDAYPYNSREEAQDACETRGLTLCSQSSITNFPLCKIGWLTDERGLWSIGEGCGFGGFTDGGFFGVFGEGGAYCCGRPLYMPNDIPREQSYIYSTREEGLAACETKGLGLCSKEQITGYELCSYGWLTDDVGLWMSVGAPGCGPAGFSGTIFPNNGAYCCVEPAPTLAPSTVPTSTPSAIPTPLPTPPPTPPPTPLPSTMPSSRPTFELMEGDHLQNEHYVYYMPDDGSDAYPYNSREEAQDACETKGLTLCSQSAITNFPLCKIEWLTDERGLWSIGEGCGFGGFTDGGFFGVFGEGGAYCCGRPLFLPEDRLGYPYFTREEGLAACETKGLGLCSKEQITGNELCSYGWLTDDVGLWMSVDAPGCGPAGFSGTIFPNNGAYCCAVPS